MKQPNKYSTGNSTVDALGRMSISGNVIPQSWYRTITKETTGKPYLAAIVILADIVYWYRPTEVRDESTGETVSARKRFKADMLQRSYSQIAEQFGITKRDATNAIVALEGLGVIKRHFRKMEVGGMTLSNVLFIELVSSVLESLTFPEETPQNETGDTYHSNRGEGTTKSVTPQTETSDTYTKTTQETTQENSKDIYMGNKSKERKTFKPPTFDECKKHYKEKGYTFDLDYFYNYYNAGNWTKNDGTKVKNWKRCMVTFQHNAQKYDKPASYAPISKQAIVQHTQEEQAKTPVWGGILNV